ncbi:MAG: carbohydrate ABC transporter permease [bacterium]
MEAADKTTKYKKRRSGIRKYINLARIKRFFYSTLRALIIMGVSYIILFPLISQMSSSFMSRTDIWDQTVSMIPRNPTLTNYRLAWEYMEYPAAFLNSLLFTSTVSIFQLFSCTLVGYGFARFEFTGKRIWFGLVIFSLVIPPQMLMTPLYLNFRFFTLGGIIPGEGLNLLETSWTFILPAMLAVGFKNGLFIYIMRQFFKGMPGSLEEAAYVDGAGPFYTFFKIMLPGAIPGLVVVFLFSFVWQWNEYQLTSAFMGSRTLLPIMLEDLVPKVLGNQYMHAPEEASLITNTGSILLLAPLVILYTFLQRYFIESVERTGITG